MHYENLELVSIEYLGPDKELLIEKWTHIKDYERMYSVSDLGRVKSLQRKTFRKLTGWGLHKERILKQTDDGRGYLAVQLNREGKGRTTRVHQLVAVAFKDHTIDGHNLVPNHIDFNKFNNRASNLEIVTARENSNHLHLESVSVFVGVDYEKRRTKRPWRSRIHFEGMKKHLGYFDREQDAAEAYLIALHNIEQYGRIKLT